jgi:hypothetical protein
MDSDARRGRAITCARAIWEISRAFLPQDLRVDFPESVSIILQRFSCHVAFAALSTVAMLKRTLLKQLKDSEGKGDSHRGREIATMLGKVLGVPDPFNARYQGCGSSDEGGLIAVTEFISSILLIILHLENPSHEDVKATSRTLEELCDGLDGRTFTASGQGSFSETSAEVRRCGVAARSTGMGCLNLLTMALMNNRLVHQW